MPAMPNTVDDDRGTEEALTCNPMTVSSDTDET